MNYKKKEGCKRKEKLFLGLFVVLAAFLLIGLSAYRESGFSLNSLSSENMLTGAAIGIQGESVVSESSSIVIFGSGLASGSTPILNSSSLANKTNENLTVYYHEGVGNKTIINWKVDGKSLTLLNVPFEPDGAENATNYATGASGTHQGGIYNLTGGYDGKGAYEFDGGAVEADQINFSNVNLNHVNYSIEVWAKFNDNTLRQPILALNTPFTSDDLLIGIDNTDFDGPNITFGTYSGSWRDVSSNTLPTVGQWYHIVAVQNDSHKIIYINGQKEGTLADTAVPAKTTLSIGKRKSSNINFNGTVDELRIYNHSLSAEQISALYNNRTDLIVSQETIVDNVWQACVTPNDGVVNGVEVCSNSLTIVLNNPPSTSQIILNATSLYNYSTDDLTCYANITDPDGGTVYANYTWHKDGVQNLTGQSAIFTENNRILVSTLNYVNTSAGENWTCSIKAYDGIDYETDWNNASINISNCGKIVTSSLTLNDNLICRGTGLVVGANSVTIDCNNYLINHSINGSLGYGIDNSGGYDSLTIKNCKIAEGNVTTSSKHDIYFSGGTNSKISNNTLITIGSTSYGVGLVSSSNTNEIYNNTFITSASNGHAVDVASSSNNNNVTWNTMLLVAGYGVDCSTTSNNGIVNHNKINTTTGFGISTNGCSRWIIDNNTIYALNRGLSLYWSSHNLNVTNNFVNASGADGLHFFESDFGRIENNTFISNKDGIYLTRSHAIMVSNNNITTSTDNGYGINLESNAFGDVYNCTIQNNIVKTSGATSYGIWIQEDSANNSLINNNVTTVQSAPIFDESVLTTLNSLTYNNSMGKIFWNSSNLTTSINLSINTTIFLKDNLVGVVNHPNVGQLNTTAKITFYGLAYAATPWLYKDGIRCDNGNLCNVSYDVTNGILYANITSFSNYTTTAQGLPIANSTSCGYVNGDVTLTSNVNATDHCFTINASHVVLDCANNLVNYSIGGTLGYGVNNTGFDNVTVKNCKVYEGNVTTSAKYPIYFGGMSNGTIQNITINAIGAHSSGIFLSTANSVNVTNVTITTTDSRGIELTSSNNNTIVNCNVSTSVASQRNGFALSSSNSNSFLDNFVQVTGTSSISASVSSSDSNLFTNNTFITTSTGTLSSAFYVYGTSENNVIINNNFSTTINKSILDTTGNSYFNSLVYNNSLGEINWNKTNLTTYLNLAIGTNVFVESNNLGLTNHVNLSNLNSTAQLTFKGLNSTTHLLYKSGVRCDNLDTCNITTDSGGIVIATVSAFSNYTTIEEKEFPVFNPTPQNQTVQYGSLFSYDINATDDVALGNYSINDTTRFVINNSGYIENVTALSLTLYWINITINDTSNNLNHSVIFVNVTDTTSPYFVNIPQNQTLGYSDLFAYQINASDNHNVSSYTVNDTTNFKINSSGYLENATSLPLALYWLNITINDTFNNTNSSIFFVNVTDSIVPNFVNRSQNQTINYGDSFAYQINASDNHNVSNYSVNDTTSFVINGSGYLENVTALSLTLYWLNITINDSSSNTNSSVFFVNVTDITSPYFVNLPQDQAAGYNISFAYQISASDNYNISNYTINDTTHFKINNSGYLENATNLSIGIYNLNVSINDSSSNTNSSVFFVNVTDQKSNVTLTSPAASYSNSSAALTNVSFVCNVTDDLALVNLSLYLTDSSNTNFIRNQTTNINGKINSSNWTFELGVGAYTWNCLAQDIANNKDWGDVNRTIILNYAAPGTTEETSSSGSSSGISCPPDTQLKSGKCVQIVEEGEIEEVPIEEESGSSEVEEKEEKDEVFNEPSEGLPVATGFAFFNQAKVLFNNYSLYLIAFAIFIVLLIVVVYTVPKLRKWYSKKKSESRFSIKVRVKRTIVKSFKIVGFVIAYPFKKVVFAVAAVVLFIGRMFRKFVKKTVRHSTRAADASSDALWDTHKAIKRNVRKSVRETGKLAVGIGESTVKTKRSIRNYIMRQLRKLVRRIVRHSTRVSDVTSDAALDTKRAVRKSVRGTAQAAMEFGETSVKTKRSIRNYIMRQLRKLVRRIVKYTLTFVGGIIFVKRSVRNYIARQLRKLFRRTVKHSTRVSDAASDALWETHKAVKKNVNKSVTKTSEALLDVKESTVMAGKETKKLAKKHYHWTIAGMLYLFKALFLMLFIAIKRTFTFIGKVILEIGKGLVLLIKAMTLGLGIMVVTPFRALIRGFKFVFKEIQLFIVWTRTHLARFRSWLISYIWQKKSFPQVKIKGSAIPTITLTPLKKKPIKEIGNKRKPKLMEELEQIDLRLKTIDEPIPHKFRARFRPVVSKERKIGFAEEKKGFKKLKEKPLPKATILEPSPELLKLNRELGQVTEKLSKENFGIRFKEIDRKVTSFNNVKKISAADRRAIAEVKKISKKLEMKHRVKDVKVDKLTKDLEKVNRSLARLDEPVVKKIVRVTPRKLIEEKKTKIKIIKVSKKLEEKKRLELQRLAQLNKELSAVEMRLSNVDFVVGRKRIITKVSKYKGKVRSLDNKELNSNDQKAMNEAVRIINKIDRKHLLETKREQKLEMELGKIEKKLSWLR
ncbi:hypothetical protein HOE37_05420 [Candidatus Woesearchaeota archaeon]|jgi:parallel beta-helix repeat protein|nr:hypothetical protein [Candidatus Woesearchaeota archaeon]MBT4111272.1 hypothetical protein [Candidatus Woesearchaeota archaeon]MBT4335817.1 hypothetical protein [Candidatus Woesearchaeota archaeon]MBT4469205.1 hypothetical protein [Candidatus Woesearchaeota archaeon]MBT6744370.1 hypothetical protein [Candidatus Woesearchaeota archaeon]